MIKRTSIEGREDQLSEHLLTGGINLIPLEHVAVSTDPEVNSFANEELEALSPSL